MMAGKLAIAAAMLLHQHVVDAKTFTAPINPPSASPPGELLGQQNAKVAGPVRQRDELQILLDGGGGGAVVSGSSSSSSSAAGQDGSSGGPGSPDEMLHTTPVVMWANLFPFTTITLGTPPQPFRAMLDISFPDIFVTSSECSARNREWEAGLCMGHFQYHHAWSRTHLHDPSGRTFEGFHQAGLLYLARASSDAFSVAGLEVQDQGFQEGLRVFTDPFAWWADHWDAVLGMAADGGDGSAGAAGMKGPLARLTEDGAAAAGPGRGGGVVSIMLGRWNNEVGLVPGEMAFGGWNEALLAPGSAIKFLSMSNRTDAPPAPGEPRPPPGQRPAFFNGTWQVPARSVAVVDRAGRGTQRNDTVIIRHDLPSRGSARIETAEPGLWLPVDIVRAMDEIAKPTMRPEPYSRFRTVPCSLVRELPDLVFVLGGHGDDGGGGGGGGEEFVLRPEDYIFEYAEGLNDPGSCVYPLEESMHEHADDLLLLGTAFVRAWYIVLDRKKRSVGFGSPVWRSRMQ